RPYFTLPTSCTGTITITGATLTATIAGAARTYTPNTGTGSGALTTSVQTNAGPDPLFTIPGADLAPGDGLTSFVTTFAITVTYTQNRVTTVQTLSLPSAATATFEKKTNALRVLVVPMGDASQTFSSQFPA